uniref:Uncharacterized protein n=1 Tax=Timema shepardi TaxID=629360 RepID=A0A7R9G0L1_TIMSH|nr:unnamed protein product [Timema shepardi]
MSGESFLFLMQGFPNHVPRCPAAPPVLVRAVTALRRKSRVFLLLAETRPFKIMYLQRPHCKKSCGVLREQKLTKTYCMRLARLVVAKERQDSQCMEWRRADIDESVVGGDVEMLVVRNNAQSTKVIIESTWTELPSVAFVNTYQPPTEIQETVCNKIIAKQLHQKAYFDKRRYTHPSFDIGEVVMMRHTPVHTGKPTKGQLKYRGPLVVLKVFPDGNTYRVSQLTEDVKQKHYATTAHVSQLKSWGSKDKIDDGEPVSGESEDDRSNGSELKTTKPDSSPETFSDSSDVGETGRDQDNLRTQPIQEWHWPKYLKDFITGVMLARLVVVKERQDSQCVEWQYADVDERCASEGRVKGLYLCNIYAKPYNDMLDIRVLLLEPSCLQELAEPRAPPIRSANTALIPLHGLCWAALRGRISDSYRGARARMISHNIGLWSESSSFSTVSSSDVTPTLVNTTSITSGLCSGFAGCQEPFNNSRSGPPKVKFSGNSFSRLAYVMHLPNHPVPYLVRDWSPTLYRTGSLPLLYRRDTVSWALFIRSRASAQRRADDWAGFSSQSFGNISHWRLIGCNGSYPIRPTLLVTTSGNSSIRIADFTFVKSPTILTALSPKSPIISNGTTNPVANGNVTSSSRKSIFSPKFSMNFFPKMASVIGRPALLAFPRVTPRGFTNGSLTCLACSTWRSPSTFRIIPFSGKRPRLWVLLGPSWWHPWPSQPNPPEFVWRDGSVHAYLSEVSRPVLGNLSLQGQKFNLKLSMKPSQVIQVFVLFRTQLSPFPMNSSGNAYNTSSSSTGCICSVNLTFQSWTRLRTNTSRLLSSADILCAKLSNADSSLWDWSSCPATERVVLWGIPSILKLVPGLLVTVSPFLVVSASGSTVSVPPKLSCPSSSLRSDSFSSLFGEQLHSNPRINSLNTLHSTIFFISLIVRHVPQPRHHCLILYSLTSPRVSAVPSSGTPCTQTSWCDADGTCLLFKSPDKKIVSESIIVFKSCCSNVFVGGLYMAANRILPLLVFTCTAAASRFGVNVFGPLVILGHKIFSNIFYKYEHFVCGTSTLTYSGKNCLTSVTGYPSPMSSCWMSPIAILGGSPLMTTLSGLSLGLNLRLRPSSSTIVKFPCPSVSASMSQQSVEEYDMSVSVVFSLELSGVAITRIPEKDKLVASVEGLVCLPLFSVGGFEVCCVVSWKKDSDCEVLLRSRLRFTAYGRLLAPLAPSVHLELSYKSVALASSCLCSVRPFLVDRVLRLLRSGHRIPSLCLALLSLSLQCRLQVSLVSSVSPRYLALSAHLICSPNSRSGAALQNFLFHVKSAAVLSGQPPLQLPQAMDLLSHTINSLTHTVDSLAHTLDTLAHLLDRLAPSMDTPAHSLDMLAPSLITLPTPGNASPKAPNIVLSSKKVNTYSSICALSSGSRQLRKAGFDVEGEDPALGNPNFWDEVFLLKPKVSSLEAEIQKLNGEQLVSLKDNINTLFKHCITTLGHEHNIRVVYALQSQKRLALRQGSETDA